MSPQMQREAEEYLNDLKREKYSIFSQTLGCQQEQPVESNQELNQQLLDEEEPSQIMHAESTSMVDLPMDLTMCVAGAGPNAECNCCNCILNDETCKIIGDVNDPTSLAAMILNGVENAKDTFDVLPRDFASIDDTINNNEETVRHFLH